MRKLTQKLVLSVVTMALVVIALGTSTFAWFTLTNKASVGQFTGQVTAGEGIEISLGDWDDVNEVYDAPSTNTVWYTVLPSAVIQAYITNMYDSFRFDNLTSADGSAMRNEALSPVTYSRSARYIEFVLYFRSTAAKTITWNQASLTGLAQPWTVNVPSFLSSDNSTTWTINQQVQVAAWTGARISVDGDTTTVVYQAPSGLTGGVYNSNEGVASYDLGLFDHDSDGGTTPEVYVPGEGTGTPYGAAAYGILAGKTTTFGTVLPTIASTTDVNASPASVLTLGNLTSGYYLGNLTVRVWIEGFDADTFDAIFNAPLAVQIAFGTTN